ncbi:MAG: hypothetical protein ACI4UA_00955, partial [Bacteroidaceae bacterium]
NKKRYKRVAHPVQQKIVFELKGGVKVKFGSSSLYEPVSSYQPSDNGIPFPPVITTFSIIFASPRTPIFILLDRA